MALTAIYQITKIAVMLNNNVFDFSVLTWGCYAIWADEYIDLYNQFVQDIIEKFPIYDKFIVKLLKCKLSVLNTKLPRGLGFRSSIILIESTENLCQYYNDSYDSYDYFSNISKLPLEIINIIISYDSDYNIKILTFLNMFRSITSKCSFVVKFEHDNINLYWCDYEYEDDDNFKELVDGFDNIYFSL